MGKLVQRAPVPPKRIKNIDRRNREYLTPNEIEKLLNAQPNKMADMVNVIMR